MSSLRNVVFTLNNYVEEDFENLQELFNEYGVYMVYGKEVAPSTGTPHLQGYIELNRQVRWNTINTMLDKRAWIAARKGNQDEAIKYAKKDDDCTEMGAPKRQGCRSDLDATRTQATEEGMRAVTSIRNFQQINVANKFLTYNESPRDFETLVTWIWGPSGIGKTKYAYDRKGSDCYVKNTPNKWFDGYDGHTEVIIDDLKPKMFDDAMLLALLDRYEVRVECKGGSRQWKPVKLWITSIYSPEDLWALQSLEDATQLKRRIDQVIHMEEE